MPSQRPTAATGEEALLDAAYDCVMDVGLRRTTLADVARRAGVSRMTIYRQHADLQTLVGSLLTRELLALVEDVRRGTSALPTARERLVETAVTVVARLVHHPLYRRVLDLDPELLLPLIVDRFGSTQRATLALVAAQVEAGRQDGSVRAVDPQSASVVLQLTAQSFVFSARVVDGEEVELTDELRRLLDGYLR